MLRVYVDPVTGRWSGMGLMMWVYQCHTRASEGRDKVMSVNLDITLNPGAWTALVTYSVTITNRLNSLQSLVALE